MKDSNLKVPVPCGKCPNCIARRVSQWSFRLYQEDKHSDTSYFITLTYDTNTVHITKNGFMGIVKRDVQLFIKRVRKVHAMRDSSVKYFAVGEYGGKSYRPHYHIIIFNVDLELMLSTVDLKRIHYSDFDGKCPVALKQWDKGHATIGKVSGASVGYSLKYISKPSRVPIHRNDDRLREFCLMSKGLGLLYMSDAIVNWHKESLGERQYCVTFDGKKVAMPRYYKRKMYDQEELGWLKGYNEWKAQEQLEKDIIEAERNGYPDAKAKYDEQVSKMHRRSLLGTKL